MNHQTKQKRPKCTLEFKQDAAQLVIEKNDTYQQAADSLGISLSAMGRWVRAERSPVTPVSKNKSVLNLSAPAEWLRLRQENEQLQMERDILKKAAVFFAKEVE